MKVEVDQVLCCGEEITIKKVLDIESKKNYFLFLCKYCKKTFELGEEDSVPFKK